MTQRGGSEVHGGDLVCAQRPTRFCRCCFFCFCWWWSCCFLDGRFFSIFVVVGGSGQRRDAGGSRRVSVSVIRWMGRKRHGVSSVSLVDGFALTHLVLVRKSTERGCQEVGSLRRGSCLVRCLQSFHVVVVLRRSVVRTFGRMKDPARPAGRRRGRHILSLEEHTRKHERARARSECVTYDVRHQSLFYGYVLRDSCVKMGDIITVRSTWSVT